MASSVLVAYKTKHPCLSTLTYSKSYYLGKEEAYSKKEIYVNCMISMDLPAHSVSLP